MPPQAPEVDCEEFRDVLDPMTVPSRGAPKKKLKSSSDKTKSITKSSTKCSLCKGTGHNWRTCFLIPEVVFSNVHQSWQLPMCETCVLMTDVHLHLEETKLPEDVLDFKICKVTIFHLHSLANSTLRRLNYRSFLLLLHNFVYWQDPFSLCATLSSNQEWQQWASVELVSIVISLSFAWVYLQAPSLVEL